MFAGRDGSEERREGGKFKCVLHSFSVLGSATKVSDQKRRGPTIPYNI
jgi:hypothetical protein